MLEQLRALHEQIPEFALVSDRELRKIRRAGYDLDADIAREAVSIVDDSKIVQDALRSTAEELRQAQEEAYRWETVEAEFRVVLRGLTTANAIRRRRIAQMVQQAVAVSSTLVEKEQYSDLIPHVENVRRIRKRKRGK